MIAESIVVDNEKSLHFTGGTIPLNAAGNYALLSSSANSSHVPGITGLIRKGIQLFCSHCYWGYR